MNQELLTQLQQSAQLPSLPAIAIKALELARRENVNISEITALISNDPALCSKILRTVNSPFYGLPKQVSTISHALVILGLQAVKTLALGFSLLKNLKSSQGDDFDYLMYWKRSIYSGVAGRLLAKRLNIVQQEEAFLCGLMGDIGTLVMHRVLGAPYDALLKQSGGDQEMLVQLCHVTFDLDHAIVSGMLADTWQLPPLLAEPIRQHHQPVSTDAALRPLVDTVYVAMIVGELFASANPAKQIIRIRSELATRFKLSAEAIEDFLAQTGAATHEAAKLFEVNIGPNRSYQEILDEANQTLIQLTLQTQQQVQEIKRENQTLQHKATTDALTGLANRQHFNEFIEEQFARAYKLQRPLSILFIDVDHFKKVNDTYGHQAGDEVLKRVGKLLKLAVRNIDLAGRYGGEEFALVLTETETNAATQIADEIRQALASEKVIYDGQTISVNCSVGVAGTDRTRLFQTAAQLTNAADRAVYAAKAAGRNCVRLFKPRPPGTETKPANQPLGAPA